MPGNRLSALDSSFLHLEREGAHMHVASIMIFEGRAPRYVDVLAHVERRLHLVPRFRQRLADVPLQQGRPVWVDDPHFNLRYHVRHSGLPAPGHEGELRTLAGRLFAQRLDRAKPLWELYLVDGLDTQTAAEDEGASVGFALITKVHHALVDGVSGADISTVLLDTAATPAAGVGGPARPWTPSPLPSRSQLLAEALLERATEPREAARGLRRLVRAPRQVAGEVRDALTAMGALTFAGLSPAPPSSLNVPIGPHRRYTWVDADLADFKRYKTALGGTINDVVLTVVTGALGRFLRDRGEQTDGLVLRAMVPVSVRAQAEQGALGNRVAAMWAPLPVGIEDPLAQFAAVHEAMAGLKESGQAVGAQVLTELVGFAPPTILSQAARLQARQRYFNLVVTNVPGPQFPLYVLGRRLRALYPVVPLARNQALGIAILSYNGRLGFGLLADYDALPDLEALADALRATIGALAAAAGEPARPHPATNGAPPTPTAVGR